MLFSVIVSLFVAVSGQHKFCERAESVCVELVEPRALSLTGGQLVTLYGNNLSPSAGGDPLDAGVIVSFIDPANPDIKFVVCDRIHVLSNNRKIVCKTRKYSGLSEDLDGNLFTFWRGRWGNTCESPTMETHVTVNGVGGLLSDTDWNSAARCKRWGRNYCNVKFRESRTPSVNQAIPSTVAPGELILVKGRVCSVDEFKTPFEREQVGLKSFERVLLHPRDGSEAFLCEISEPQCDRVGSRRSERCPTQFNSSLETDSEVAFPWFLDPCVSGEFHCRVPKGVPEGVYNISFSLYSKGGKSLTGNTALQLLYHGLGEYSSGAITVGARIDNVTSPCDDLLEIQGAGFKAGSSVILGNSPIHCPIIHQTDRLIVCNRTKWASMDGEYQLPVKSVPAMTCLELLKTQPDTPTGWYTMSDLSREFCEMDTLGGGWSLCAMFDSETPHEGAFEIDRASCKELVAGASQQGGHLLSFSSDFRLDETLTIGNDDLVVVSEISKGITHGEDVFNPQADISDGVCETGRVPSYERDGATLMHGLDLDWFGFQNGEASLESEARLAWLTHHHPAGNHYVGAESLAKFGVSETSHNSRWTLSGDPIVSYVGSYHDANDDYKSTLSWEFPEIQGGGELWIYVKELYSRRTCHVEGLEPFLLSINTWHWKYVGKLSQSWFELYIGGNGPKRHELRIAAVYLGPVGIEPANAWLYHHATYAAVPQHVFLNPSAFIKSNASQGEILERVSIPPKWKQLDIFYAHASGFFVPNVAGWYRFDSHVPDAKDYYAWTRWRTTLGAMFTLNINETNYYVYGIERQGHLYSAIDWVWLEKGQRYPVRLDVHDSSGQDTSHLHVSIKVSIKHDDDGTPRPIPGVVFKETGVNHTEILAIPPVFLSRYQDVDEGAYTDSSGFSIRAMPVLTNLVSRGCDGFSVPTNTRTLSLWHFGNRNDACDFPTSLQNPIVGTGCGSIRPSKRFNYMLVRKGPIVHSRYSSLVRENWDDVDLQNMGYTDGFNSPVISKLGPPREMFIIPDMSQDERRFHDENADAFQRDSGIFTAPMDGVYKFSWEAYDCGAMYFYLAETPFAKDLVHQTTSNTLLELEKGQAIAIESRRAIKTCTATNLWRYQGQGTVSVQLAKAGASEKIEDIARFFPVLWKGNRYSGPISDVFLSSPKRISFPTRPIFKGTRGLLYEEWLYSSSSAKERPTGLWSPHCGQFGPPLPPLWLQPNFSYTVDSIGGKRHANTLWGARPGVWYYRRFRGLFQSPVTGDVSFSLWVYGVQVHISVGTNEQIESAQVVGCNHWDVTTSWLPMEKGKLYYFEVTEHQHRDRTDLGGISGLSLRLKANPKSTDKNFHKYVNAAPIASSQDNSDSCHTTSDATNPDDGVTVLKTIPSGLLTIITESPTVTVSSKRGVDARCVECDLPPAPEIDECPLLGRSLETDYSNSQPESIPDAASFVPDRLNLDDLRLHAVGLDEHRSLSTARQFVLENRERVLLEDKETTEQYERWSDQDTWGGRPPDELTEIVYIPAGKYILLDVPHVSIRIVVVEGTLKVSGDIASCVLETEALIVNGENAKFIVGTITEPFLGQFNLRLLGHWRSPVLPVFGIKVLGATKGASLSMVGKETVSWTRLATSSGDGNVIVLVDPVDWKAGDKIIVSSTSKGSEVDCSFTRDDSCETEEREVKSINLEGDQVTLDRPLRYLHIGGQRIGNHVLSSEVAKLSRNIVIEGVQDDESKSFGGHVMMLNQKSVFQFVELKNVGQAFQLGRYPLHFHLVENADQSVSESIVKGCSIHSSFNRALVCHACNNLRVYQNVAYKVLGHTFFLEDGVESGNDFVGNLGVLTMRSFSLLETDQTPATFWITNANNKFVGNVAAGAHSFGFWINLPEHSGGFTPRGASFSQAKWPGLESSMLDMKGNIAHSNGAAGFFFSGLDPRKQIRLTRDPRTRKLHAVGERTVLTLRDFFTFGNGDSGIMAEHVGHVHFKGVTSAHEPIGFNLLSVIADKWATEENNYDGFLLHEAFFLSNSICGFGTGLSDFGMFMNITLKDMPVGICGIAALNGGIDRETTHADIGGVEARTSRLTFINTRLPVAFSAPFQAIYYDIDGSLTGIKGGWAHAANGKGLDSLGHFPPDDCTLFSSGHYIFCDSNVVLRTFRWASPRQPLYGKQNALITTSHGSSYVGTTSYSITGVMGALRTTLVMGMKHQITFPFMLDEIEYTGFKNGELCGLRKDDPVALVSFPVLSKPDHFNIFKQSNTLRFPDLLHPPEWYGKARLGSWKLEESSISFVASSTTASGLALGTDEQPASNRGYGTTSQVCIQGGMERVECPQIGCSLMTCVHQTMDTSEQGETSVLFSDLGITDGESVLIPKGQTVLFDIERSPVFDRFEVYGKLVLDDTGPRELSARHIIVHRGGEFEIGSKEKRFQHDARIVLVGKNDDDAYEGTSLGSKFLAVFGRLIMYGREKEQSETLVRSALKSDIQPGATQMEFYSIPVGLQIGDRLLVTTCTLVANETETVQVTNIDSVFVYTTAFEYTHLKRDTLMNGRIEPSLGTHVAILGQPNIRIEGSSDPDSFGASIKVLRGSLFCDEDQDDEDALNQSDGYAEIDHVHFLNCGQYGRSPCLRFGVMGQSESRRNLQCSRMMFRSVDGENSFVTNSVFEGGVHTGIALVNTVGVRVQGNVIDNRAGTGVLVFGHHNIIENNLVSRARFFRFPRSWYQSVTLDLLPDEGICFDVFGFQNQVRGNIAAGSDLVGFFVPGEPCSTPLGERLVNGNIAMASPKGVEVRGYTFCDLRKQVPGVVYPDWPTTGNVGVREFYHVNDGVPRTCIVASGYTIVRTMVFGINSNGASGVTSSLVLEHNELIDTGIAISRIASQGTSVAPISTKSINSAKDRDVSRPDLHLLINSSRIVGSSYRCHQVGVIPASFYEKSYSLQPLWSIGNRVALLGGTSIFNVSFTGFGQYDASSSFSYAGNPYHISECTSTSVNYVISMEPERQPLGVSPDFSKVVLVERITLHGDNQLLNFPWAPTAGVYGVGDSGCAQFPCDGSRNGLLIDLDGSFIGTPGTAVAENEQYFHDDLLYIDPLGAKTMRDLIPQTVNLDTWKPGIGALDACTKKHNHYICPGGKHRQLLIEDMESTSFERRIAPVAMVVADRISLLTGPKNYDMKKSWGGAASIHRDNNFCPIGVLDELNQVHFTSSPPKRIRIHLRDVKQSEGLLVGIWFNLPNGFDIYADNTPVKGTLLELPIDGKGVCTDQSKHGYSYYSPLKSGLLFVCVVGTTPITINMKPVVRIGLAAGGWKELTREEFFQTGYEGFVSNVALLLGIPKDRIAFAGQKNQSPAERRVLVEHPTEDLEDEFLLIINPPVLEDSLDSFDEHAFGKVAARQVEELKTIAGNASKLVESGDLSAVFASNVPEAELHSVGIIRPKKVIPGWTGPIEHYNASDGCDCSYGILDPDCLTQTNIPVRGCSTVYRKTGASELQDLEAENEQQSQVNAEEIREKESICSSQNSTDACALAECCYSDAQGCGLCEAATEDIMKGENYCATNTIKEIEHGFCDYTLPNWSIQGTKYAEGPDAPQVSCDCNPGDMWDPDCELGENIPIIGCPMDSINPPICFQTLDGKASCGKQVNGRRVTSAQRKKWSYACDCDFSDMSKCLRDCKENRGLWGWTCDEKQFNRFKLASSSILDQCTA